MKNWLALSALFVLTASCVVRTPAGTSPTTAAPTATPPADNFPRTGGATREGAEPITIGAPVEGVVMMGHELFYKFEVQAGVPINFAFYTEAIWTKSGGMNASFNFLDPYGGKLYGRLVAVYATHMTSDFDKSDGVFKPKADGTVYLQVSCIKHCRADVHYKITMNY